MRCMGSDISHTSGFTRFGGVGSPGGLGISFFLRKLAQPSLRVFNPYFSDVAKYAILTHGPGLFHHGVSRVGMREAKQQALFLCFLLQLLGFVERESDRLFNNHMKSMFQRHHGRGKVNKVGRNDGYKIHSFFCGQLRLLLNHLLIAGIGSVYRQQQCFSGFYSRVGVGTQGTAG